MTIARSPAPEITGGPDGRTARASFLIKPLTEIGPFLAFAAGSNEVLPLAGGGTITRKVPLRWPDDAEMYVDSYNLTYLGKAMDALWQPGLSIHTEQYNYARMDMFFRTLPEGVGSGQVFYTISTESGVDVETIPDGGFVTAGGRKVTGDRGIFIPGTILVVTTYLSPTPVSYTLRSLVGRVNSVDFEDHPPGTLRFDSVRQEFTTGSAGQGLTKSFAFKARDEPWNKVLDDLGAWDYAYSVATGQPKYKSTDLNLLKTA